MSAGVVGLEPGINGHATYDNSLLLVPIASIDGIVTGEVDLVKADEGYESGAERSYYSPLSLGGKKEGDTMVERACGGFSNSGTVRGGHDVRRLISDAESKTRTRPFWMVAPGGPHPKLQAMAGLP
jgi:hypothetical protein